MFFVLCLWFYLTLREFETGGAGGVVVIHLALHQWVRGSILATGCMCKWISHSMLALAGFLRDLRFPPAFKIGTCLVNQKHPLTQGEWGAVVLKSGCHNLSADRQCAFMAAYLNEAT